MKFREPSALILIDWMVVKITEFLHQVKNNPIIRWLDNLLKIGPNSLSLFLMLMFPFLQKKVARMFCQYPFKFNKAICSPSYSLTESIIWICTFSNPRVAICLPAEVDKLIISCLCPLWQTCMNCVEDPQYCFLGYQPDILPGKLFTETYK
jgi:hypothetical protein